MGKALPLFFVVKVCFAVSLSKKEPVFALGTLGLSLLHEGAERGDSGSGADHDEGSGVVFWERKVWCRLNVKGDGSLRGGFMAEEGAGGAAALLAVDNEGGDGDGEVNFIGKGALRRGNGVKPGEHGGKERRKVIE